MFNIFIALFIGALLGLVVATLMLSAKKSSDEENALGRALDEARIDYLERTKTMLLYNPELDMWGITDLDNRFVGAGATPRAAIDQSRAVEQATMQVPA